MSTPFQKILSFIAELDTRTATYRMSVVRPEAILVEVAVPGERWEVEFFDNGNVEVERFRSSGDITSGEDLSELWESLE